MERDKFTILMIDLQLFAEEKTEEPTAKRKEEARSKGQVIRSMELNSALVLIMAFLALKIFGPYIYNEISAFMRVTFQHLSDHDLTVQGVYLLFLKMALVMLKIAAPIMLTVLITGLLVNFLQIGFLFTVEPLQFNLDRLNPVTGFQRLLSKRAIVELIKALIKVFIVGYVAYRFILEQMQSAPAMVDIDLAGILAVVGGKAFDLSMRIGAVLLVMAVGDYAFQWWDYHKNLRMSKQEVKEELKQTEGNPQIKAKVRERQRLLAVRRMMQEVPKADVVITNPTHLAVALKYDAKTSPAPVVVAKGQDFVAEKIKAIAEEHRVVIVENKPLAQTLYKTTEVGDQIPADLYQAVAEVLAYVYKLKGRI